MNEEELGVVSWKGAWPLPSYSAQTQISPTILLCSLPEQQSPALNTELPGNSQAKDLDLMMLVG